MTGADAAIAVAKLALRDQILLERRRRDLAEQRTASRALADHVLESAEVARSATVAVYLSVGTEPGTFELLDGLRRAGRRVIAPILTADLDLDWAEFDGDVRAAPRGLWEPTGRPLGVEALAVADLVLVPGLAVDRQGHRLGRGGGSYDRALARVPVGTPVWMVAYDSELVARVPVADHDRTVVGVVRPAAGITRWVR